MTKRILVLFVLLAALMLPAVAATKAHHRKHAVARSRRAKSKVRAKARVRSVRKSTHHRARTAAARRRAAAARRRIAAARAKR
jgi:hypothetical protein